ncbi:hypothetical protein KHA90_11805 [Flavobacterium psychroterrae]|jgi:hypothetical protein|uniref:Recombinase domain-containing protein n=1 Tax=Flavobacterium psychroterrae TaxID=2133767 RepID=A0ABS5PDA1_9FLAO|nr:hypothetical protein [Flavobacterium psychroterrae]MBS7231711.1 hypothetical protein [Flavobacterium psychroterrae]
MITCNQKEIIIEILGKQYSPKIISHLSNKNIYNSDGHIYSTNSIQKIVSGKQPNDIVELEIAKLVAKVKRQKQNAQDTKNKLLK